MPQQLHVGAGGGVRPHVDHSDTRVQDVGTWQRLHSSRQEDDRWPVTTSSHMFTTVMNIEMFSHAGIAVFTVFG